MLDMLCSPLLTLKLFSSITPSMLCWCSSLFVFLRFILSDTTVRRSRAAVDLLTVVSDRIARTFVRIVATWAVALDVLSSFDRVWHDGFNAEKTQLILLDRSKNCGAINVKVDGFVLDEKSFKMLGLSFSSKLDWDSYIVSIAKIASKAIGSLIIHSLKFLSLEVPLCVYIITIWSCMEYYCHLWTGAPN